MRCVSSLYSHRQLLLSLVFGLSLWLSAYAQDASSYKGEGRMPPKSIERRALAIHDIQFELHPESTSGSLPSNTELLSMINSRACDFSLTSRLLRSVTYEAMANPDVPRRITTTLQEFYTRSSMNELRYFDRTVASLDVYRLRDFFEQLGYHDANIRFVFQVSRDRRNNILRFIIYPRSQYKLEHLVIQGIDSLPPELRTHIVEMANDVKREQYNEPQLNLLAARILDHLHNNGYAFARMAQLPLSGKELEEERAQQVPQSTNVSANDPKNKDSVGNKTQSAELILYKDQLPLTVSDTIRKQDSSTIYIQPLKRFVFGSTSFIDSTRGNPFVVNSLKQQQLDFKPGEFYNLSALRRAQAAISSLGPFDRVAIDTLQSGDSILTTVFSSYKRSWDLGLNLFINNTFPDNLTNAGIEASWLHRNIFHDANSLSINGRYTWRGIHIDSVYKEIVHWLFPSEPKVSVDKEFEITANYAQPNIMRIGRYRVDGTASANYADRYIVDPFSEASLGLHAGIQIPLAENTERLTIDLLGEIQKPRNYAGAFERAYQQFVSANPLVDTVKLRADLTERLDPYKKLDEYTSGSFRTTNISLAFNYYADKRNDIFDPSRGHTENFLFEFTPFGLLTNYYRILGSFYSYGTISERWTSAWKIRGGHIMWRGFTETDSGVVNQYIVPADRGFFAGGASSIRSFASRQLGNPASDDSKLPSNVSDLANYVGWASVIEISAEMRYTFPYYPELGEFLADKIRRLGFTFFVDLGNAFNRLTPSAYGKAQFFDVVNPVNWALATGAGLRFATPAGPIRLDIGINVYDPMINSPRYSWIFNRSFMNSLAAQISLGHAF